MLLPGRGRVAHLVDVAEAIVDRSDARNSAINVIEKALGDVRRRPEGGMTCAERAAKIVKGPGRHVFELFIKLFLASAPSRKRFAGCPTCGE